MQLIKKSTVLLLSMSLIYCNSKKKYYNDFHDQLSGNYEIAELNYISSQGADSTIFDAGTFYFENCEYDKTTSESICGGSIYIQSLDTEGSLEYHIFDERTMYISVDWLSDNEKNPLIYANCEVFFDGKKTILNFKDKESAQESNFNFYPFSIVLSKY